MKIGVKKEVFQKFHPKLKIGFVLVKGINNKKWKESQHLLKEMVEMTHFLFRKKTLKTHHLISPWTAVQEEFGADAKHYQTSLEKLLRKATKKKSVGARVSVTNLCNYFSLKHVLPVAVDDVDKVKGDLTFQLASGKERVGVLRNLKKGAFFYKDSKQVLGTKLDYWKSAKTKVGSGSKNVLIHMEALPPMVPKVRRLVKEMAELVESFCGGKVSGFVLDKKKSSVKI